MGTHLVAPTRWKVICAYHGKDFFGWQSQPNRRCVQDVVTEVLTGILRQKIVVHGSSRTDTGVHARGFVFHFDAAWRHPPERLLAACRTRLPPDVFFHRVQAVGPDFHARFSARRKQYIYYLKEGPADPFEAPYCWGVKGTLDPKLMQEAANHLIGCHDFAAYSAFPGHARLSTVRNVSRLDVRKKGRQVRIIAEADGFLYKMVRSLVGGLAKVGQGILVPEVLAEVLASRERTALIPTAPPQGLFLEKVIYREWKGTAGETFCGEKGSVKTGMAQPGKE